MPLTIETAGAPVSGAALSTATRTILVVRPFVVGGQVQPAGATLVVPRLFAVELVAAGKATLVDGDHPAAVQTPAQALAAAVAGAAKAKTKA